MIPLRRAPKVIYVVGNFFDHPDRAGFLSSSSRMALSGGTAAIRLELDIHPDFFLQCIFGYLSIVLKASVWMIFGLFSYKFG